MCRLVLTFNGVLARTRPSPRSLASGSSATSTCACPSRSRQTRPGHTLRNLHFPQQTVLGRVFHVEDFLKGGDEGCSPGELGCAQTSARPHRMVPLPPRRAPHSPRTRPLRPTPPPARRARPKAHFGLRPAAERPLRVFPAQPTARRTRLAIKPARIRSRTVHKNLPRPQSPIPLFQAAADEKK